MWYSRNGWWWQQGLLQKMCDAIIHRGPDSEGVFSREGIHFGMRRLAIIDLSGGSQPIYNEDKTLVITFNGEIYNYQALKKNLEEVGHIFTTNSDTEVILHLFPGLQNFVITLFHPFGDLFPGKLTCIFPTDLCGECF